MESKTESGAVRTLKAHLALNVRSVEESIGFYRKMFGIEPCKVREGYAKFDVENPPLNLTLNQNPFGERGALSHLGVQVASTADVLTMRERWRAAGLSTFDEMGTNCCYAVQDKTWVTDPDGNNWEAFVVLEDNLAETNMCCTADAADIAAGAEARGAALCTPPAESKSVVETAGSAEASAASCCGAAKASAADEGAAEVASSSSCCAPAAVSSPVSIGRG